MDQLKTIFRALGTPTEDEWPVRGQPPHSHYFTPLTFVPFFEGSHKAPRLHACWAIPKSATERLIHRRECGLSELTWKMFTL